MHLVVPAAAGCEVAVAPVAELVGAVPVSPGGGGGCDALLFCHFRCVINI